MLKRVFLLGLMLALAAQSFLTMADVHQSHQSGTEHLNFDHDTHEHPQSSSVDISTDEFDCHHCCHCHSVGFSAILLATNVMTQQKNQTIISAYKAHFSTPDPQSLYRPPIV